MQRRVFLAGVAGAAATLAGCSGGGGGGGGGSGTIVITNDTVTPTQVAIEVSSGGSTVFEDEFSLAISGDSATETLEGIFEDEAPDSATVSITVGTSDPTTHEWAPSEQSTLEATITQGDTVEFGGGGDGTSS
jgi:hypothetical protein